MLDCKALKPPKYTKKNSRRFFPHQNPKPIYYHHPESKSNEFVFWVRVVCRAV
jgi:hypothetical protein